MTALARTVTPIRSDVYEDALRVALSAENDWGKQLQAAQVLAGSPDWKHVNLARHIRDAHALHEVGLLRPAGQPGLIRGWLIDVAGFAVICGVTWAAYVMPA